MDPIHTIRLKPGEQDRLLAGHPWIYQNELEGWPPEAATGDLVDLHDSQGRFLGRGYLNPRTTIAVRVLARDRVPVDQNFFLEKIRQAQALREHVMAERSAYRVVHGEADGLPGLVVDRYGDAVAIQLLTAGMDRRRDLILSAVEEVLRPHTIVARNDSTMREREGLSRERTVIRGQIRSEEHTSELQSRLHLVCRLLLEKKKQLHRNHPISLGFVSLELAPDTDVKQITV